MTPAPRPRPLGVRHLVPALGRVPRAGVAEGTSGLVGSALGIARAQAAMGYRAELYGWRPDDGPRRYHLDGVAVAVTPGWSWARTSRIDARVIAPLLAKSALDGPVDVAHAYSEPHLLLAPRARARVLHFQTPVPETPPLLYSRLVSRADLVVCCSDFIRRQLLSRLAFPAERVAVVHNGVDLRPCAAARTADREAERRRRGIAPDEVVLLYVGAVVPEKGLLHLLRALALVRPAHPCRLAVAGGAALWPTTDDPYPDEMDAYTQAVRAAGKDLPVTWLGVVPQDQMPAVYALADVFICPSVWEEPFGTVNVEAMAAGAPVVASRVGGVPEAVAEGETGLLVPPADEEALAGALATLVDDPDRRRRMGAAGRVRAGAFTWERAAERLDTLYREVLR
jgi:glycosyltransferase involved in cell wall biosynthesis